MLDIIYVKTWIQGTYWKDSAFKPSNEWNDVKTFLRQTFNNENV